MGTHIIRPKVALRKIALQSLQSHEFLSHMLHGAGICTNICPNKIAQFCR